MGGVGLVLLGPESDQDQGQSCDEWDVSSPQERMVGLMCSRVGWALSQAVSSPSLEVCKERPDDHPLEMLWEDPRP